MRYWVKRVVVSNPSTGLTTEMTFDEEDLAYVDEVGLHFKSCDGERAHIPLHRVEQFTSPADD